jgi:hypothetical protein
MANSCFRQAHSFVVMALKRASALVSAALALGAEHNAIKNIVIPAKNIVIPAKAGTQRLQVSKGLFLFLPSP